MLLRSALWPPFVSFALVLSALPTQVPTPPSLSPTQATKPPGQCTVTGRVLSAAESTPLRSAQVALVEAGHPKHPRVYATTTDIDGQFEIKQVVAGRYEFFASKVGYVEQHYQSKDIEDEGAPLSLSTGQAIENAIFRLVRAGVVIGRVVDDTGEPMMGAYVSVLRKPDEEEREKQGPRARNLEMTMVSGGATDDRGEYRIYALKPGEYFLKATASSGHSIGGGTTIMSAGEWALKQELGSPFVPLFYPGVLQFDQAQSITVLAGQEMQADFAMRKIKTVVVAGKVLGPDGGPATHAYVQLAQPGLRDFGSGMGALTDSGGEFSIKGVPPGSYTISTGTQAEGKFYNTRQGVVVGETSIDSIVLTLGHGVTIHGRMRTDTGAPLPAGQIMVHLEPVEEDGAAGFVIAEVNKGGSFEFNDVADGSYSLGTGNFGEGWFLASARIGNVNALESGVQVGTGSAKGDLDLVISNDGAQLEGTVTDADKGQPIVGVVVRAQLDPASDLTWTRSLTATTDQNGHYVLKEVPPHKYNVSAKLSSSAGGAAPVRSALVPVTLNGHDHKVLDFKLNLPRSE